jgi:CHAD domain-containing protein
VEDGDVEAVHRTRVASRRLREALPVLQLDPDLVDKLSRKLRKITRRLGKLRDLDVLADIVTELRAAGRYPEPPLARLAASISEQRSRAHVRHLTKSQIRGLHRVAHKLEKVARTLAGAPSEPTIRTARDSRRRTPDQRRSIRWAVQARIGRRATMLARTVREAGSVYLPERLHAVRIAIKKLRYAVELDAELAGVRATPALTELRRAQDVLGRLHDLQVLIDRTREEQASLSPPDLRVWRELDLLVGALEDDCRRLHGRYVHDSAALLARCSALAGRADDDGRAHAREAKVHAGIKGRR